MSKQANQGWSDYWTSGTKSAPSSCLPSGSDAIQNRQQHIWREYGSKLPRKASVLDLATGDGIVLRMIRQHRPDLRLIGIDASPTLPPAPKGIKLKSGMSMEKLSFQSESFDAITSRFGFEYAGNKQSVDEIVRVLRPTGSFLFIIHHRDGPIVRFNMRRRAALHWVVDEQRLIEKAMIFVRNPLAVNLPVPDLFKSAVGVASQLHPQSTASAELSQAIWLTLSNRNNGPIQNAQGALLELKRRVQAELQRLDDLERAACDEERVTKYQTWFETYGFSVEKSTDQDGVDPAPYCWILKGHREP
ncbi:class I SAM-dependent methyltransferase [uncultured Parasphingorhabdus sp.]|uniref:class I SAM-dependent methyltransferase n=1 Tax=uncultured Parasphingorhabdus sp. TaxID=2709694 RepID=UPI0030D858EF|tara:strand:- start:6114 stop:7022 length:909 start_codon:yes stop_codon:yes gene_type:complete